MIDRNELKNLLDLTQLTLLRRITKLTEASQLIDKLRLELDGNDDEFIKVFIVTQLRYRKVLNDQEMDWDEIERDLWNKMIHIDQIESNEDEG